MAADHGCIECGFEMVEVIAVRAALEGMYEDARSALTAPTHQAFMQSAQRLERLLGIEPGVPQYGPVGGS